MSLRLEMLQVARLAPKLLGESAALVTEFLRRQQNPDGGFKDRTEQSDLYYTVFGLDGLLAVQAPLPTDGIRSYLESFGVGRGLDFVHLCCLARAWAASSQLQPGAEEGPPHRLVTEILGRIEGFRAEDGGYSPTANSVGGTAYACFLALGAYQDLGRELPASSRLAQCLKFLETEDGAWANDRHVRVGSTNATAAAVSLLRHLDLAPRPSAGDWLLARCHAEGGFVAAPNAPMPDLLSTATALHALAGLQVSFENVRERCLDFIDTLWTNAGSFYGHWGEDLLDSEYTFYGLLALGHLSL